MIKKLEVFVAVLWSLATLMALIVIWDLLFFDSVIIFLIYSIAHYLILAIALPFLLIVFIKQKTISKWFLIGISSESILNTIYGLFFFSVLLPPNLIFSDGSSYLVPYLVMALLVLFELLPILLFYQYHRSDEHLKDTRFS